MSKKIIIILAVLFVLSGCSSTDKDDPTTSATPTTTTTQSTSETAETTQTTSDAEPIKSAVIQLGEHDVEGHAEFRDDNTLVLSNFSYDGEAPDVFVSLGTYDSKGEFVYEVNLEKLERAYDNETIIIDLGSTNLANYTAISIWCDKFSEDFGSAEIVEITMK